MQSDETPTCQLVVVCCAREAREARRDVLILPHRNGQHPFLFCREQQARRTCGRRFLVLDWVSVYNCETRAAKELDARQIEPITRSEVERTPCLWKPQSRRCPAWLEHSHADRSEEDQEHQGSPLRDVIFGVHRGTQRYASAMQGPDHQRPQFALPTRFPLSFSLFTFLARPCLSLVLASPLQRSSLSCPSHSHSLSQNDPCPSLPAPPGGSRAVPHASSARTSMSFPFAHPNCWHRSTKCLLITLSV